MRPISHICRESKRFVVREVLSFLHSHCLFKIIKFYFVSFFLKTLGPILNFDNYSKHMCYKYLRDQCV